MSLESAPSHLRTIVVGTDFSPAAAAAVAWASALARRHGARVHAVHALELYGPPSDFLVSPPDLTDEIQAAALAKLDELSARQREEGVEATHELRLERPHAALVGAAAHQHADLLIVGTRGVTGLEHLLLGSTAQRVVARALCPVLAVHPEQQPPAEGLRHLLVPTDFSEDAERALEVALRLAAPGPDEAVDLTLLHAYFLPIEYTAYGTIPTSPHYLEDVAGEAERRLTELAERLGRPGLAVASAAVEGYPPEVILREAQRLGAELVAMGTHGRSGLEHLLLGSTAERVVQRAPCPVLTVRRPA